MTANILRTDSSSSTINTRTLSKPMVTISLRLSSSAADRKCFLAREEPALSRPFSGEVMHLQRFTETHEESRTQSLCGLFQSRTSVSLWDANTVPCFGYFFPPGFRFYVQSMPRSVHPTALVPLAPTSPQRR